MKGIKYVSEANPTGYGQAGRGYLNALLRSGFPVTWTPMVPGKRWRLYLEPYEGALPGDPMVAICNRPIDYDTVIVHTVPDYYARWRETEPGKRLVGMTVWESDTMPPAWHSHFRHVDAIVVPTEWNRRVFQQAGVRLPIGVVPHVAPDAAGLAAGAERDPLDELEAEVPPGDFVFYTVGMWTDRKAMHLTLQAYLEAFDATDAVTLVIKTEAIDEMKRRPGRWWWHVGRHFSGTRRTMEQMRNQRKNAPRVVLINRRLTDVELHAIHRRGNCYVSLTRAEGWGLGAFEAACHGKPVIMTGHGGQTAFLPADLADLVDYSMVSAGPVGEIERGMFAHGDLWAEPDLQHAVALMRQAYRDHDAAAAKGAALRCFVTERFARERVNAMLLEFLERA